MKLPLYCIVIVGTVGMISNMEGMSTAAQDKQDDSKQLLPSIASYTPLIASRSVEKLAKVLNELPENMFRSTLLYILDDTQSSLRRTDKCELIFALIVINEKDKKTQKILFEYLQRPAVVPNVPLLFIAAHGIYSNLINPLIKWTYELSPEKAKEMVQNAYLYAIKGGYIKEFQHLYLNGALISPEQATTFLWKAVDLNQPARFAKFLVKAKADINKTQGKWTPLTRAVSFNNYDTVKVLVEGGADVNKIPAPETGSPLQIALRLKNAKIELFLRENGAFE